MSHTAETDSLPLGLRIRKATEADSPDVLACLRTAFEPYRTSYTDEAFAGTVLTPETFQRRLSSMCIFVALDEAGHIIGTIACTRIGPDHGHLRGMAVMPDFKGRSLASVLLRAAEDELATRGCSRITLNTTDPLQRAVRFYEKHGYRPTGRSRDYFGMVLHEYAKNLSV